MSRRRNEPEPEPGTNATSENDDRDFARILVVPGGAGAPDSVVGALERIGGELEIQIADDLRAALRVFERRAVDLLVCDRPSRELLAGLREGRPPDDPPLVVVTPEGDDAAAVGAFRQGAADCVVAGPDLDDVLPVVALEQIQRVQGARARGETERRIRWLERLNDAIVTQIPNALAVLDGRERVMVTNPEFDAVFGTDGEAARGRPFDEVIPPEWRDAVELRQLVAEVAADRRPAPVLVGPGAPGTRLEGRVFDVRAQRLADDGHLLVVLSDVSEREALHRRVGDLQRYNEKIIQNMNSALVVADSDGRITFANHTAEQVMGCTPGELLGRAAPECFPGADGERSLVERTLATGARFKGAETVLTRADGRVVPIGISCAPLADPEGLSHGAVAIFQDLTEIKQLQRQVLQTEKMASIGQLAAGVAHEINNPMGFIHANLFQMSEYLGDLRKVWEQVDGLEKAISGGDLDEAQSAGERVSSLSRELDIPYVLSDFQKAIRESQEGSERIRHIVQDLRDFSHQDTAERVLADVNQCVDSTANIVWTMMKHSVVLEKEYCELPRIRCYPMQLKQVFMNLLVNAYQAIEEALDAPGETGRIEIRTERADGGVLVAIKDSGVGIDADCVGRIFDPFFTTKAVGAGTGLGLSTSYSIVQRHGGRLAVESRVGQGTTFSVWLPIDAPVVEELEDD